MCSSKIYNLFNFQATLDFEIDWLCEKETIKRYFKREVLSLIEKGEIEVGEENGEPCANCYVYKANCGNHMKSKAYTFEELKKSGSVWFLRLFPEMSALDFARCSLENYNCAIRNWHERIEFFSWNQESAE
jgi:hypothetical protein